MTGHAKKNYDALEGRNNNATTERQTRQARSNANIPKGTCLNKREQRPKKGTTDNNQSNILFEYINSSYYDFTEEVS